MLYKILIRIIDQMKLHNSTEMSPSSYLEQKFVIKYNQITKDVSKRKKGRYSLSQDSEIPRVLTSSEVDVYKSQQPSRQQRKSQDPKTHRNPRKKTNLVKPNLIFGSMMQAIQQSKSFNNDSQGVFKKQEKQMPRIPIEFNDEKANGVLADLQKIKVVYRGYAPKNTFFFFKALTSKTSFLDLQSKSRSDSDLEFNSKFQSGNLSAAARKSQRQYWLYMRQDTNTFGLRQWYYFSIFNRKVGKFRFRIYRFSKYYSLYKQGMKPFAKDDKTSNQWRQRGTNIKYQYDFDLKCHYLEFQYEFTEKYLTTEFATQPPYTYSMLKQYLELAVQKYPSIRLKKAGVSLAGLEIPKIQIKSKSRTQKKQAILIIARTHPSQTASNYALESFIERIYELKILRQTFDFYIIPMVNPDGVFLGNHRTGVLGQDINRNFNNKEVQYFPEVNVVQCLIEKVQKEQNIAYMFDLHGHSAKKNIFAFGDESMIGTLPYLQSRIIPKILSDIISTFKYKSCLFKRSKDKKNTARVYLSQKYKINIITFEESYGLIDEGPIGIRHWKNFGTAIADALLQYSEICRNGDPEKMGEYLSQTMQNDKRKQEQKLKKKMLLMERQREKQKDKEKQIQQNKNQYQEAKCQDAKKVNKFYLQQFKKFKTEMKKEKPIEMEFSYPENKIDISDSDSADNSSELSSGDQTLENDEEGVENLKKQILKIGCLKDGAKREKYNVAEKKLEIRGNYEPRLHEQRSSMIPRILKYQMKRKQEEKQSEGFYNFQRESHRFKSRPKGEQITQRESIELPYIRK